METDESSSDVNIKNAHDSDGYNKNDMNKPTEKVDDANSKEKDYCNNR